MEAVFILDVIIAYVLDLFFGDPYWFPHPVRFIGWLISRTEKVLRKLIADGKKLNPEIKAYKERIAGIVLALFVISVVFSVVYIVLQAAKAINPLLFRIINIYFIYSALATKCLADEALKVYNVLQKGDLNEARKRLSMLVGRQTKNLSEDEVIRGVVETTAENTVDGVISPLIYAFIGSLFGIGGPLVYAFKAISTLDSMVGYMNEKYVNFGRASAKIDDLANFIPARLAGLIIPFGAFLSGKSFTRSLIIMVRDRRNHKSPNSAYPEAAVAGALGVMIGGNNVYFGKIIEKPTIGDPIKELEAVDIHDTIRIVYASSLVTLFILGIFTVVLKMLY